MAARATRNPSANRARPSRGLAVLSHADPAAGALDLRTSPDEIEFVRPDLGQLWRAWLDGLGGPGPALERAAEYGFEDPYGEYRSRAALTAHHGHPIEHGAVTFSTGITALLRQLAPVAGDGCLAIEHDGHPDLASWSCAGGAAVETYDHAVLEAGRLPDWIAERRPGVVALDRPTVHGHVVGPEQLLTVAGAAAEVGALVLVDEAYANYLGPAESVVALTARARRLVVLRGVSKAYCMGGLRIAYAVASRDVQREIRRRIAPLGVATLPFLFALELLAQGDVFGELRTVTAEAKREAVALLGDAGFAARAGHPALPWVLVDDPEGSTQRSLMERGIVVRRLGPTAGGDESRLVKLAIPLSPDRRRAFRERLGGEGGAE